jgi:hypothetical protein
MILQFLSTKFTHKCFPFLIEFQVFLHELQSLRWTTFVDEIFQLFKSKHITLHLPPTLSIKQTNCDYFHNDSVKNKKKIKEIKLY